MKEAMIYLDAHASTPVDQEVLSSMLPYFTTHYANGNHKGGWKANAAISNARFQVANLVGAQPSEITFTSGATEAINMGLLGLVHANKSSRRHIVTQQTEHKAVLECIAYIKSKGYRVSMLKVDAVGRICLKELRTVVSSDTLLIAIMLANNEIGTVQPVQEIGTIAKENGALYFCDITQGVGWCHLNLQQMGIDMAAMSSHKIYGPRGVGALYLRKKPSPIIAPLWVGGGQERGLRPGTHNLPGIVGLGKACALLEAKGEVLFKNIAYMRNRLEKQLCSAIEGLKINGCPTNRHPGNLSIVLPNGTGDELKGALPNLLFSTSSACTSTSPEPSHVLSALPLTTQEINASIRFGIHKHTTIQEIDWVASNIIQIVTKNNLQNAL